MLNSVHILHNSVTVGGLKCFMINLLLTARNTWNIPLRMEMPISHGTRRLRVPYLSWIEFCVRECEFLMYLLDHTCLVKACIFQILCLHLHYKIFLLVQWYPNKNKPNVTCKTNRVLLSCRKTNGSFWLPRSMLFFFPPPASWTPNEVHILVFPLASLKRKLTLLLNTVTKMLPKASRLGKK